MPAGKLAEHFDPQMGRPTKELYSMAGLLFIMEFRNWTHEEAADAYMFNIDAQSAQCFATSYGRLVAFSSFLVA